MIVTSIRRHTRIAGYDAVVDLGDRLGRHRVRVDGVVVELQIVGTASLDEAVAFHELLAEILAERGRCYVLADLSEMTAIDPRARRYVSDWNRGHRITAGAAYGASFKGRVIFTLLLNAIRLMNSNAPEVHMARSEPEARRWIAAHVGR